MAALLVLSPFAFSLLWRVFSLVHCVGSVQREIECARCTRRESAERGGRLCLQVVYETRKKSVCAEGDRVRRF